MYIKQQPISDLSPVLTDKHANKLLLQVNNQMIIVEDSEALADILGKPTPHSFYSSKLISRCV